MAVPKQLVVTLTGAAQQVTTDRMITTVFVSIQPAAANTNPVYVGASNAITSSAYGVRLPAPVDSIPPAPYIMEPWKLGVQMPLSSVWLIGTLNEKVHLLYWEG